jgi:hypothetical protein
MARLSFRCDEELIKRVDEARGDVARELWLRKTVQREVERARSNARAVEQALGEGVPGVGRSDDNQMSPERKDGLGQRGTAGTTPGRRADSNAVSPTPAEPPYRRQPGPDVRNIRSSQQARRDVKPFPKGKS